jgi:CMP-N-acetylneuraminate monooxygenase
VSDRIRIGRPDDFSRFPAVVAAGSRTYFLVRQPSGFALLSNVCSHQGGAVYDKGTCFECPLHGWQFDRLTGRCLNAPSRSLVRVPVVEAEDGVLFADLPRPAHVDRVAHGARSAKAGLTIALRSQTCLEISYEGFTLLTDPCLDGSDLRPDAILITHEHPDRFHEPTLRRFDRRTPVFVPDFPNERLPQCLTTLGFSDVHCVRFGERTRLRKNWTLTAFAPDGNLNGAFVLVDVEGFRIFDINDGGVSARLAKMAGRVDVLTVQCSADVLASPWVREATTIYGASSVLPFVSRFATVKSALADTDVDVIDLLPGDTWDVGRGVIRRGVNPES